MLGRKGRRFLRSLKEGGKVLLSSLIGVLSLVVNFYLVWIRWDWSVQSYYDFYKEVITTTAATAAVLIAIVIYSPEVVKVFGETFLAKRFAAGKEEGLEEGVEKGRGEGRGERNAELLKLLEESPEVTLDQLKDLLRSGDAPRNGKDSGEERPE